LTIGQSLSFLCLAVVPEGEMTEVIISRNEGLDYCSSTPTKRCKFVEFHKGLLFQCNGTDIMKIERLSQPATENEMKDDLMVQ
jgi:hypothetical protein